MHRFIIDTLIYTVTVIVVGILSFLIVHAHLLNHYTELSLTW